MGQNTLMFEVGLQRAKDKYQEIYDEVMKLVEMGGSTIKLKVQLDKASDVQDLVKQLSSLGDGTLLKPLLDRINKLMTQLDVLGVDGSRSIERLKTEYNEATEAVQKYYRMVKQMEANIAGAKTPDLKKTFEKNLEAYKSNNKIEELTNRQVTAQLNLSAANENVAKTALAASAALSNVGQGAAIKEVKDQVEALAKGLNDIVNEMKSIGNIGGGNLVKNVSKADEKTTQIAQALTKAMQDLAAGKEGAAGKEKDLAASTRDVNDALRAEKDLVEDTAKSMNTAANAITAAAIAAKSLAVVMGGNSGDVNKFIELATRLETLNNQAKLTMQAPNMTFDAKTQSLVKTREEIESVRNEMDELKKNAAVGNPLIDSFTTAFDSLNKALSSSGNLLKTAAGNMGELNANIGSVISKGNIGGTVAAQEQETQAVKETTKAVKEEEQASKQLVQSEQKVADAQKNTAQSAHEVIAALKEKGDAEKKLVSIEQKGTGQGNLFDTQKFKSLQEAIDKIVSEINRLKEAFEGIGNMEGLSNLATKIKSLYLNVNDIVDLMGKWSGALKLNMSAEEITAYERKINELKTAYDELSQKVAGVVQKTNEAVGAQQKSSKGAKEAVDEEKVGIDKLAQSVNQAKNKIESLNNLLKDAKNVSETYGFGGKGFDTESIDRYREKLVAVRNELQKIQEKGVHPDSGLYSSEFLRQFDSSGIERNLRAELSYYKQIGTEFEKIEKLKSGLNNLLGNIVQPGKRDEIQQIIRDLENLMALVSKNGVKEARFVFGSKDYKDQLANAKVMLRENTREINENEKATKKATKAQKESINEASIQWEKLGVKIRSVQELRDKGVKLGLDVTELNNYIRNLAHLRLEMSNIRDGLNNGKSLGYTGMPAGLTAKGLLNSADVKTVFIQGEEAAKKFGASIREASSSVTQLTSSEQQLANSIKSSTEQMRGQSQVLSDLKMMATQYLSVWGAQSFLSNIIETGGQLEMQRMSIGAILQDVSHANTLFERIKSLALKSPFGVVELDQMTKQLTAYGFKYNELFDMTKRLADISAATGTGVDRLALALGHVRSEAALSGYTLRQFSMGNIPLLAKLSEKLGKSTEEIRKMVRVKGISYEDVVGVLKDLTDKGGMFYNMQEVISESVKAKFKNVRDAMDIMYGEMAEGAPGDALKEVANALMEVTKNWRDVATVLMTGTALWGVHRLAVLAYTKVLGTSTAATISSIAAFRKKEAAMLRQASVYRTLTDAEKSAIATSKLYTTQERIKLALHIPLTEKQKERIALARLQRQMDLMVALSTKKLTAEELAKMVALGKLSKAEAIEIINSAKMTLAEKEAAIAMVTNVKAANSWRIALNGVAIAGAKVAQALKGLMAMMFSPQMLVMAGITAVMELWQRHSHEMEMAEEAAQRIHENAQEALKNTRTMLQETGIGVQWKRNKQSGESDESYKKLATEDITSTFGSKWSGYYVFVKPKFDADSAKETMEHWKQYIREYAATPNTLLNSAMFDGDKLKDAEEQYNNLFKAVQSVAMAQLNLRNYSDAFEDALKKTKSGWFDEGLITNVKDYQNALKSFGSTISSVYKEYERSIDRGLDAAKEQDKSFAKAVDGMATYAQQFRFLIENQNKYKEAAEAFKDSSGKNRQLYVQTTGRGGVFGGTGWRDVQDAEDTMNADLQAFYINLKANLQTQGVDLKNLSKEQQAALVMGYKNSLTSVQGLSEEEMDNLIKLFAKEFGIKIDLEDEKFKAKKSEIVQQLEDLIGRDWAVKIDYSDNITDVIKEARTKYKKGTEFFNNAKPILLKFGITWENGKTMTEEQIEEAVSGITDEKQKTFLRRVLKGMNEAQNLINNATDASKAGGFTLDDPNKNKNKEDKNAKAVRERVRVIKEAADAYQYWREKVGDDAAWAHVRKEFGKVLDDLDITANNIQDVRKHLNNIPNTKAYKAIKDKKVKTEVNKEIAKENDQYTRKDFEKQTEEFLSRTKIELDNLTRSWEMFNSVREATGDVNIAVRFSGAAYALGNAQNVADALKNQIERDFQSVGAVPIPFNAELSERDIKKQIEEQFKQYEPTKNAGESDEDYNKRLLEYQSHIKSVVEEYTKWADLQRKVQDNAVTAYVKMISDSESLKTKLAGINDEYRKQIENLNILKNLGKISPEEYSKGVSHAENTRNLGMLSSLTNEVDWSTNDEFFGRIFREAGKQLEEQLNKFIGSKEYNALDVTQQQQYLNIRDQLFKTGISGSNPLNPDTWKDLANKTKAVQNAFKELFTSTLELKGAQEAEENARKAAADGKGTPAEGMLQDKLKEATNNRVAAENNVSENQKKLKKATQDQNQASQSAAKGLQDFGNAIKGITSGSLSDLTLGIGNLIRSFSKDKDAVGSLSELFGDIPNGYGQIIAAALQLLDMLKDKSAETIRELLNGLFDAATGIIKELLNGKLVEAIIESAVEGVGKIVSEIIANIPNMIGGGIFSGEGIIVNGVIGLVKGLGAGFGNAIEGLFGFDANNSNENEVRESIDRLTKENERLTTVIEEATKELKESNGMKAINAAKEARDAQQQKNQNILEKWKNAMGYHAAHHSNASSWDLEDYTQTDVNNALREYSKKTGKKLKQINVDNWEEFMTLTPEEMNYIRTHAQGAWEDITTEGKYEWAHDFLNEYADQAGKLEEISEELKEKLTLLTLDGLHDSFLNELMDMDKSAKDFANDFKKYLMKAILNAQIADLLDTQLQEWRDAMAKYMEEDGGTLSPAHIAELQKMWDDIVAQGLKIRDETAKATGYTGDSTSGLSSNIKNVSEQTADILASYVNAIRADVAVDRHLAEQYFPMFHQSLTKGNSFLQSIVSHTSAIKASSEAIKDSTQAILDRLNGLKSGTWQVPVA